MSKELEALNDLVRLNIKEKKVHFNDGASFEEVVQNYDLVKEALKRNEPMKPNYGGKFPQCPVCRKLLHSIWQKHCDNCTQAIDWSDDE